jgi:hypothetical protein
MPGSTEIGVVKRERFGVMAIAALIVVSVAAYLALKSSVLESTGSNRLMPYQTLVRMLVRSEQAIYTDLQGRVVDLESIRAATGRWPDASALAGDRSYEWSTAREGLFVNYLGTPTTDTSASAWLIVIQEPDPQAPPDTAPNDETHHRLPDGTVLHVTIWSHRYGGQIAKAFVRQPETSGWTQILTAPVPPVPSRTGNQT